MLRLGYDKKLAIGTICAGGSLGTMIPPSVVLIVYGLTASVSIGDLFKAAFVPGVLMGCLYIGYILIRCRLNPELGPPAPAEERNLPLAQKLAMLKGLVLPLLIIVWVLGSIYFGIAAVTEAAGVGVVGAIVSAAIRGELNWKMMRESLVQTMETVGILIWLTFGAFAFIGIYNIMGGTNFVRQLITGLPVEPIVIILLMMAILLVLGCLIDWIGICLLTMPIFVPIIKDLGYDPVWFGILFCMNMQVSYLSPPFGPACFYLKGVAPPDITLQQIFSSVWPFMGLQITALALVLFFPDIALFPAGSGRARSAGPRSHGTRCSGGRHRRHSRHRHGAARAPGRCAGPARAWPAACSAGRSSGSPDGRPRNAAARRAPARARSRRSSPRSRRRSRWRRE
jgi:tripartite ATP-independent transporter DctM subunit